MSEIQTVQKPRGRKKAKQPNILLRLVFLSLGIIILGILLSVLLNAERVKEHVLGVATVQSAQGELAVTAVKVRVVPSSHKLCRDRFDFVGFISVNQKGSVTYRWNYPGQTPGKEETIIFTEPGTRVVRTVYQQLSESSVTGKVILEVISPDTVTSLPAVFTSDCDTTVSKALVTVSPTDTNSCPSMFKAIGLIQVHGKGTGVVSYKWVKNTEILKEGTFIYNAPATKRIDASWAEAAGTSGSVQLIITTPNQLQSEKVSYSQRCSKVKPSSAPRISITPVATQ